ncbi:MAG: transcriptional regulator with XRE-family HTH domain [Cocleimonas sp.]|jgi:transcriptional regulator with XRE-family HTH domain
MNDISKLLGKRIKVLRVEKELIQSELAQLIDSDPSYIGRIERGEINITIDTFVRISEALGVKPSEIFKQIEL